MTKLEYIKQKCAEARLEAIGEPVYRLADVLMAIGLKGVAIMGTGEFYNERFGQIMRAGVRWNLLLSLDDQKPEVHDFIANVLGYEDQK